MSITRIRNTTYDIRNTKYDIRTNSYTLAEAMLAVVVVGMAASGVLLPFASGAAVRADGMHRTLAAKLANDRIEQVVATADYNDYSEPQGQVEDASGTVFADAAYANFSRSVTCRDVRVPQQTDDTLSATFTLVTVQVYYRGQDLVSISRLVSRQ